MAQVRLVKDLGERLHLCIGEEHTGWVRCLEGKLLTIIDGSLSDSVQRKAVKNLVSETLWRHNGTFWDVLNKIVHQIAKGSGETLSIDVPSVPEVEPDNPFVEPVV